MAFKNPTLLSILIVTFYLVSISEAGSAKRPLNCYFCEAAALGNLPHTKGPELERCEFEDFIEINNQRSKFHLTYDKYDPLRHSKLQNYTICKNVSGYDEIGNYEIVRRCYDRRLNCTGFFYVNGEQKNVRFSPFVVCGSDTNECIINGGSGTVHIWISLLLGSCIFSSFSAMV